MEVLKLVVHGCLVVVFLGKVLRSELVNCGPATMSSIGSIVPLLCAALAFSFSLLLFLLFFYLPFFNCLLIILLSMGTRFS